MEMMATKVYLPKPLKRRAFAAFAMEDMNFSRWTREQLEKWLDARSAPESQAVLGQEGWHGAKAIANR